jgi:hypothetical protein
VSWRIKLRGLANYLADSNSQNASLAIMAQNNSPLNAKYCAKDSAKHFVKSHVILVFTEAEKEILDPAVSGVQPSFEAAGSLAARSESVESFDVSVRPGVILNKAFLSPTSIYGSALKLPRLPVLSNGISGSGRSPPP